LKFYIGKLEFELKLALPNWIKVKTRTENKK